MSSSEVPHSLRVTLTEALRQTDELAGFIEKHFVSVLDADICDLEPIEITDLGGRRIKVQQEIDRAVGRVFLEPAGFNETMTELVRMNWSKHATPHEDPELVVRVSQDETFVSVVLEDNIPEAFGNGTDGDIGKAQAFCRRYGGWSEITSHDVKGRKRLILRYRRLPPSVTPRLSGI
jgi:hypothetical protein